MSGIQVPALRSAKAFGTRAVDLYFGPTAPAGKEPTGSRPCPAKGWFVLLRLYGPLEPWFDQTWRPGAFEFVG
jgi:hypothetical protein